MIRWTYTSEAARIVGARPPEPMDLDYGRLPDGDPRPHGTDLQRAHLAGRPVVPADCPPIQVISRYGFVVRSPGAARVRRNAVPTRWREFADGHSAYGWSWVSGDRWPEGDSGFVPSWISGSEFVKIHTGITLFYPADHMLLVAPVPNLATLGESSLTRAVMSGLEYYRPRTSRLIDGQEHARSTMNVIVRIPDRPGEEWSARSGDPLAWVIIVPKKQQLREL